jgi:hypothetical protein
MSRFSAETGQFPASQKASMLTYSLATSMNVNSYQPAEDGADKPHRQLLSLLYGAGATLDFSLTLRLRALFLRGKYTDSVIIDAFHCGSGVKPLDGWSGFT